MGNIPITIATNDYDRTRAVKDGAVSVDGCDVTYFTMLPEEMFFRAVRYAELDVTELSLSTHMLQTQRGDAQYLGIPVFLSRVFRHSGFYIRTDRDIASGADLKGKTVGVPEPIRKSWMSGFMNPSTVGVVGKSIGAEHGISEVKDPSSPTFAIDAATSVPALQGATGKVVPTGGAGGTKPLESDFVYVRGAMRGNGKA